MKFRYFMRDCSRMFRKRFYKFSAKLFGSDEISKTLKEILESNRALSASVNTMFALNSSKIPQQIKDDFLLQILATPGGGIRFISENCVENLKGFLRLVRPVSSPSIVLRRFGGAYDGGYVMMIPPFLRDKLGGVSLDSINIESSVKNTAFTPPPPVINSLDSKPVAISLGVSPYSPWDLEMANLGYKVLQYDASIESAPYNHKNITFFKKFVGVSDSENTISLQNVITQNALDSKAFNILQCDIEDSEWAILDKIDLNLMAKYFPQALF